MWQALKDILASVAAFLTGMLVQKARGRADAADATAQIERRARVRGDAVRALTDGEFDERMRETDKRIRAVQSRAAERL